MTILAWVLLVAISYQLTRLMVREDITFSARMWVAARSQFFGGLVDCYWCFGTYVTIPIAITFAIVLGLGVYWAMALWVLARLSTGLLGTLTDKLERH